MASRPVTVAGQGRPETAVPALPGTAGAAAEAEEDVAKRAKVKRAFKRFDLNGDGMISKTELSRVMKTLNGKVSDKHITSVLKQIDQNNDGSIAYEEFVDWVMGGGEGSRILEKAGETQGAERFYYDKSSYTGVHRRGGPSVDDRPTNDFASMTRTSLRTGSTYMKQGADHKSVPLAAQTGFLSANGDDVRKGSPRPSSRSETRRLSRSSAGGETTAAPEKPESRRGSKTNSTAPEAKLPALDQKVTRPITPRGPERLYYDKSTYTGVHARGGPGVDDRSVNDFTSMTRSNLNHGGTAMRP